MDGSAWPAVAVFWIIEPLLKVRQVNKGRRISRVSTRAEILCCEGVPNDEGQEPVTAASNRPVTDQGWTSDGPVPSKQ